MIKTTVRITLLLLVFLFIVGSVLSANAQEQTNDDIIAAITSTAQPQIIQSVPSPSGELVAEVSVYPCTDIGGGTIVAYERLDLVTPAAGESQQVAEQLIYCGGLGAIGLSVIRWSADDSYLFFTDAREGVPDGLATGWVPPLWRARLADMQVENLGSAAFSPDGMWLVTWTPTQISYMSPLESVASAISLPLIPAELQIDRVFWLPDASGIVYVQTDMPFAPSVSTITHIDLTTMEQTILLDTRG